LRLVDSADVTKGSRQKTLPVKPAGNLTFGMLNQVGILYLFKSRGILRGEQVQHREIKHQLPHAYGLLREFHENTCHLQERHCGTRDGAWCLILETWEKRGLPQGMEPWNSQIMRDAFEEGWNVKQLIKHMVGKIGAGDASSEYVWVVYANIPNGEEENWLKDRMVAYLNGDTDYDPLGWAIY
jgi:hypothetical protein